VPFYNLGLHFKNTGRWEKSLFYNQRALKLAPTDQAACWNLGIAATALKNWTEAHRAWKAYGVELEAESGEVRMPRVAACVRLNPKGDGEVVWGLRIDPARIVILSVPLPESGHRFHDIVLNDGASEGTRIDQNGREVPVFNELSLWEVSEYSTYSVRMHVPDAKSQEYLVALCDAHEMGVEDWSTLRFICAKCSRGNPGPHHCEAKPLSDDTRRFGFGAKRKEELTAVLQGWTEASGSADFQEPQLLLAARAM